MNKSLLTTSFLLILISKILCNLAIAETTTPNATFSNNFGKKNFYLDVNLGTASNLGPVLTWNVSNQFFLSAGTSVGADFFDYKNIGGGFYFDKNSTNSLFVRYEITNLTLVSTLTSYLNIYGTTFPSKTVSFGFLMIGWSAEVENSFHFSSEIGYLLSPSVKGTGIGFNIGMGTMI